MKDRIAHIMRAKNLKASDFANLLGIQPSGISHILSGRNQPSLEFVKKIKETFPEYNLDWIIFGTGPITTSDPFLPKQTADPSTSPSHPLLFDVTSDGNDPAEELEPAPSTAPVVTSGSMKTLVVLYDDGTFETFAPRQ